MKKRILSFVLVVLSAVVLVGCKKDAGNGYTYRTYSTSLASNWNPHSWETNADSSVLGYIESPLVDMSIKNSATQEYQWTFEAATAVEDVTADHQDDLTTYKVTLPKGKTADQVTSGYVYEITLREGVKWENGTAINADTYVKSMAHLLDSKMRNYRANLYIKGESALAGALAFYNSEAPIYEPVVPAYGSGETPDYSFDLSANKVYIKLDSEDMTFSGYSFSTLYSTYGIISKATYEAVTGSEKCQPNPYGYIEVTAENKDLILALMDEYCSGFNLTIYTNEEKTEYNNDYFMEFLFYNTGRVGEKVEYDGNVGLYKVSDYKIRYVLQNAEERNYFLTSLTSNWIVYEDLYVGNFDTSGELTTTTYNTSKEKTMSYGPYRIESLEAGKQLVYVQNENWWGYTKDENGKLYSETEFLVDGNHVQQYKCTKVVVNVMTDAAAKQAFLKGELDDWAPTADEVSEYTLSDKLYQVDETYTMSLFFNNNVPMLQTMDASKGNQNSVVLSNDSFRKAFSLAINRNEWVTATAGYKPAFALLNRLYYYDVYDNPNSIYRDTDQAKQAIVGLYGVEYGEGKAYKTLDEAVASVNGYNLTEAKALMKQAHDELVAAGLYVSGQDIKIKIAWKKGALESDDQKQVALLQGYLNAAVEGSGFGKVTLEAVGNIADRYGDVPKGEYAIGYGAWGGAAFYPFRNLQVYMDSDQYDINEGACWDPSVDKFTMVIDGDEVTMTYKEWSNCMIGSNAFADADFETKLTILSTLEQDFLSKYYRIPLAGSTSCSLLSYKLSYYTENYNIMYGFGGLRLIQFNYNDSEWQKFVRKNSKKGVLSYN